MVAGGILSPLVDETDGSTSCHRLRHCLPGLGSDICGRGMGHAFAGSVGQRLVVSTPTRAIRKGTQGRTYAEQIEAVLAEMVPKERLDGVRTEAAVVALAVGFLPPGISLLDEAVWVVRLVSGMTSSDWRHIESQVLSLMDTLYPPLPLRQLAHRLRSRGWGYRRVAGELGVSVTHVRRLPYLDENSPS